MSIRSLAAVVGLLVAGIAASACNGGPLPFLSGGQLEGEERPVPERWELEEDFAIVQLETRPEDPYSINLAYTLIDGELFLNAGDTETQWVQHMEADPRVRLRISDGIYPLRAVRVTDPVEITAFGDAWTSHSMFHRHPDELEEVWIYRLVAR
jgi:hypothetical protein